VILFSQQCPDWLWGHPPSYSVSTGYLSGWVKYPGPEVDYSSPYSTKVKDEWSYTSAPPCSLWCAEGHLDLYLFLSDCFLSRFPLFPDFLYFFFCCYLSTLFYSFHFFSAPLFLILSLIRPLVCHNALRLD
jgi:hypothetical protein